MSLKYFSDRPMPKLYVEPTQAAATKNEPGMFGNLGRAFGSGALSGLGGIFDFVGAEGIAKQLYGWSDDARASMSQEAQQDMAKSFFAENDQGETILGEGLTDLDTWLLTFANVAGQFVPTAVPGAGIAGAATKALSLGTKGANVARAAAFGATGGASATGQGMEQARQEFLTLPDEVKMESDLFRRKVQEIASAQPELDEMSIWSNAEKAVAEQIAQDVRTDPKVLLANFAGSALADPIIGKALTGARIAKSGAFRSALKGFVAEGSTEAGQAAVQEYGINEALSQVDGRDAWDGVGIAALNEGLAGGTFGAGAGLLGGFANRQQPEVPVRDKDADAIRGTNSALAGAFDSLAQDSQNRQMAVYQAANTLPDISSPALEGELLGPEVPEQRQYNPNQIGMQARIGGPTVPRIEQKDIIFAQDGRDPYDKFREQQAGQVPAIEDKNIIFAPDNSGVKVDHRTRQPFESEDAALKSKTARQMRADGLNPTAVQFGDGWGLVLGPQLLDSPVYEGEYISAAEERAMMEKANAQYRPRIGQSDVIFATDRTEELNAAERQQRAEAFSDNLMREARNTAATQAPRLPQKDIIYAGDGRAQQAQQEFAQNLQNQAERDASIPRLPQKDIIFAPDNSGVRVKGNGDVFKSPREAVTSKQARATKRTGVEVEAVQFGDGWGWRVKEVAPTQVDDTNVVESSSDTNAQDKPKEILLSKGSKAVLEMEPSPKAFSPLVRMQFGEPISIIARNDAGEEMGRLVYMPNGGPIDVNVNEKYRRKGVATALYDELEARGGTIPPMESGVAVSKDAELFRANRASKDPQQETPVLNDIQLMKTGKPFSTEKAMTSSLSYKTAVADGAEVETVKVEGGFGFRVVSKKPETTTSKTVVGTTSKAFTPSNKAIDVQYRVMEADDLIASNDISGAVNTNYPAELQPRDRSRADYQVQMRGIAKNPIPEKLGESTDTDRGAPIVSNGVVESGNGRTIGLKEAYRAGTATAYRDYLVANAEKFGLDPDELATMKQPVLVRERMTQMTPEELTAFTVDSNANAGVTQSPAERAKSDASLLDDSIMSQLVITEDGDLTSSANGRFVRAFAALLGNNEAASYKTADGQWNKSFKDRLMNAVFAKGYEVPDLLASMSESTNPESKNLLTALMNVAGKLGTIKSYDNDVGTSLSDAFTQAATLLNRAKREGTTVAAVDAQADMLTGHTDADIVALAKALESNIRSAKAMTTILDRISSRVLTDTTNMGQTDIFSGEPGARPNVLEVIRNETGRNQSDSTDTAGTRSLFESTQDQTSDTGEQQRIPQAPERSERGSRESAVDNEPSNDKAPADAGVSVSGGQSSDRIDDFGEKLGGARKDVWGGFSSAVSDEVDTESLPLSKSFPEPDYVKMAADGVPMETLAIIAAMRSEIPAKPRHSYKVRRWAEKVDVLRGFASDLISGTLSPAEVISVMSKSGSELGSIADAIPAIAQANPETIKLAAKYRLGSGSFSMFRGEKYSPSKTFYYPQNGRSEMLDLASHDKQSALDNLVKLIKAEAAANPDNSGQKQSKISIYSDRYTKQIYLGWEGGNGVLRIQDFPTISEAREYLKLNRADVEAKLKQLKQIPEMRRPENRKRVGPPRYAGSITPAIFADTFGFRGVEFGNWVEQEKRQKDLNEAYDALMDLADVLGIPPKALALNGELGIAFGARGKGAATTIKAAAHYEPAYVAINLTKQSGAGSLAHEWWHAVDNYFARLTGNPNNFVTEGGNIRGGDLRQEVRDAFTSLIRSIRKTSLIQRAAILDSRRSKSYWSTEIEVSARSFEAFIISELEAKGFSNDYLANIVDQDMWDSLDSSHQTYPYPTKDEQQLINPAFRELFNSLQVKDTDKGVMLFSKTQGEPESQVENDESGTEDESNPALVRHLGPIPRSGSPTRGSSGNLFTDDQSVKENPDIQFSNQNTISTKPSRGVSMETARAEAADILRKLNGAAGIKVEILATQADAEKLWNMSLEDSLVRGAFNGQTKTAYIIAENIRSIEELRQTIAHEVIGHGGLQSVIGAERYAEFITRLTQTRKNNAFKSLWERIDRDYDDFDVSAEQLERIKAEEVFAYFVQNKPVSGPIKFWWNAFKRYVQKLLSSVGLMRAEDADIAVMKDMLESIRAGFAAGGKAKGQGRSDMAYSRTTEQAEALDKLGLGEQVAESIADKAKQRVTETIDSLKSQSFWQRLNEGIFDGLAGIKQAEEAVGVVDPNKQGYVSARLASGLSDILHGVFHYGAPEWRDGVVQRKADTKGLLEVFGMLGDDLNDWLAWMGANRAERLMAEGRENNLTKADIDELKALAAGKEQLFEEVRKEYNKINSAIIDLAEDAGLLNAEQRSGFDEEWYVPFFRDMEEEVDPEMAGIAAMVHGPRSRKGIAGQSAQIKELKGGRQSTKDLLENIIQRQSTMIDAAIKNKAMAEVVGNLEGSPFMQAVESPEIAALSQTELNLLQKVKVMRNGKAEAYTVTDPALLRGLLQIHTIGNNSLFNRFARAAKRYLTAGITLSPDFIVKNFVRDAAHAWMINKDGFRFGADSVKGLRKAFTEDESYRDLIFSGAAFQGGYVHGADPEAAAQQIRRALRSKGLTNEQVASYMDSLITKGSKLFEAYRTASDKVENANRLSTFEAALAAGKSRRQAAFEAKDLMDYSLKGNFAMIGNMIDMLPFFNARLQGMSKLVRSMKGADGDRVLKVLSANLAMKGLKVAAFSLALAALNDDDERYQELPDWDKDANWHFFLGDDHYRIPKPFELGIIFGTMPERMFHYAAGSQPGSDMGKAAAHAVWNTLALNPIPQLALPVIEVLTNKSFFKGSAIEGMGDEQRQPEDRYNAYTSETAKQIGAAFGASPKMVEHLILGYTGTLGGYVLSVSDAIARQMLGVTSAETPISRYPVIKAFYQGDAPKTATKFQDEFYKAIEQANEAYGSYKRAVEEGDVVRQQDLKQGESQALGARIQLNRIQRQLNELSKQSDRVNNNQELTSEEKRQRLDDITRRKNELYQSAYVRFKIGEW